MQGAAFLVGEVITFVVSNQVNNRSLRQGCGLVEHEPPVLDMGSERAHVTTVTVSERPGKHSRCSTEPVDLVEPGDDLVRCRMPAICSSESSSAKHSASFMMHLSPLSSAETVLDYSQR